MVEYQFREEIEIQLKDVSLTGNLNIPMRSDSIVIFAHGSGSSRHSSRNRYVAAVLNEAGFSTLLFDLLTLQEDQNYSNRFQIELLSERLVAVTRWLQARPDFNLDIGYFGASTGAAATLEAAAELGDVVKAVVSRGGRPDLALYNMPLVKSPTCLIVGSLDHEVIRLNEKAFRALKAEKELIIIEGATHLFEEPGKLEEVAQYATRWFLKHIRHVYAE